MSDKLAEIIATKRLEVEALMPRAELLRAAALQRNDFGGFRSALDRGPGRLGVIAEVKKASPSVGLDRPGFRSGPPGQTLPRRRRVLSVDPDRREIFPRLAELPDADLEIFRGARCCARISRSTRCRSTRPRSPVPTPSCSSSPRWMTPRCAASIDEAQGRSCSTCWWKCTTCGKWSARSISARI